MIRRLMLTLFTLTAGATAAHASPVAVPVDGISSGYEAEGLCLEAADSARWSGQWTTTEWGRMSVCGCTVEGPASRATFDVEAGPIWSHDHAQQVCPQVCEAPPWTGAYSPDDGYAASSCELDYPGQIRGSVKIQRFAPTPVYVRTVSPRPVILRPVVSPRRIFTRPIAPRGPRFQPPRHRGPRWSPPARTPRPPRSRHGRSR